MPKLDAIENFCRQAEALIQLKRSTEALTLLRQSLVLDPSHYEVHALRALAFLSAKNFALAVHAAEDAIALAPDLEWGHRLRCFALLGLGQPSDALDAEQLEFKFDLY